MGWIDAELALTALAAMLSPTTLTFSVLVLVLGDRPLRTGLWFYLGALGATLGIGVVAAFVLGNAAASSTPSEPKTWVAVLDVVLAVGLIALVVWVLRRPANPQRTAGMIEQIQKVTSSPIVAILGAGAALANPGAFIPIALLLLLVAPDWTKRVLGSVRLWLERNARNVAAALVVLLALSLLRSGIAGLTA